MADVDRIIQALGHSVRRQILAAIVAGPCSAKGLSEELGMELGFISYHLNQVLDRDCGIVEIVRTAQNRGAVEKFYRIKVDALREGAPDSDGEGEGKKATLEEYLLALAIGVASLPDCPPPLPS